MSDLFAGSFPQLLQPHLRTAALGAELGGGHELEQLDRLLRVWGEAGVVDSAGAGGYDGLVRAVAEFFHTGKPPVDPAETLEVFEFMTAAQQSAEKGGAEVPLASLRK